MMMEQTRLNTKELLKQFNETESELLQAVSSFTEEQLNTVPFEGSWTAGQVTEHLLKSKSGIPKLFSATTKLTQREPDEKVETIKSIFLDFNTKMKSPEFIIPSAFPYEKQALLNSLKTTAAEIYKVASSVNLSETCTSFPFPQLGELTRWEWMQFVICHTIRHTRQLKNIFQKLSRNYSAISPSAKMLLMIKGYTNIPFAKEAAELVAYPEKYITDFNDKDFTFWARLAHFESRYWSINQLLSELDAKNILEISSGFSFRGLRAVQEENVHYIDTDLPEIIEIKRNLLAQLQKETTLKGKLETLSLNALDEKHFTEIVTHFSEGEIVIVNEGLLMYLNREEKEKLCGIIRNILKQHGGYWITADIYIKKQFEKSFLKVDDKILEFAKQHNIEENKFESMQEAEEFFKTAGFVIDKKAKPDFSKLTALNYVFKSATEQQVQQLQKIGKIQATWRLKLAND
jgi:O-methyltransferase involved in polyketide biosynthesis